MFDWVNSVMFMFAPDDDAGGGGDDAAGDADDLLGGGDGDTKDGDTKDDGTKDDDASGADDDAAGDDDKGGDKDGAGDDDLLGGGKADDDKGDADDPEAGKAPEAYEDFKFPDGVTVDKERLEAVLPVFKELNLSQQQAQKLINAETVRMEDQAKESAKTMKAWVDELKSDSELGGGKLSASVQTVRSMITKVGGAEAEELLGFLKETGLGNYPPFFRILHRLATKTGEDTFGGQQRGTGTKKSESEIHRAQYPTMYDKDGNLKPGIGRPASAR